MGFTTINDLRTDALWLAGEETGASVSPYYTRVLGYLDAVQDAILTGGSLRNVIDLPLEDWRWARPQPRRVLNLVPVKTDASITCTLTNGSNIGTLSSSPGASYLDYRLLLPDQDDVPILIQHGTPYTSLVLDHTWQGATLSTTGWKLAKVEYVLAEDVIRLCSGFLVQGYGEICAIDRATFDETYPFSELCEGTPQAACLASQMGYSPVPYYNRTWVRFSHYPASPGMVAEYDCIVRPAYMEAAVDPGTECPTVPKPFRRILSTGAAMLIAIDKNDTKHETLFQEFQSIWIAMKKANSRPQHRAARGYGYIKARQDQVQTNIRTTSSGWPLIW